MRRIIHMITILNGWIAQNFAVAWEHFKLHGRMSLSPRDSLLTTHRFQSTYILGTLRRRVWTVPPRMTRNRCRFQSTSDVVVPPSSSHPAPPPPPPQYTPPSHHIVLYQCSNCPSRIYPRTFYYNRTRRAIQYMSGLWTLNVHIVVCHLIVDLRTTVYLSIACHMIKQLIIQL